ncbi:MAG: hypothetical protein EA357_00150 [Micavibrio sp.]|nr:MAG: hypothetical protein EA357_00150 [Micavibrio sp.]
MLFYVETGQFSIEWNRIETKSVILSQRRRIFQKLSGIFRFAQDDRVYLFNRKLLWRWKGIVEMCPESSGSFDQNFLKDLSDGYIKIDDDYQFLSEKYVYFSFQSEKAKEFSQHGLVRRLSTLQRCIENIHNISPPEKWEKLEREALIDLGINLQSFIANIFGCFDNLAWIWAFEKNIKGKSGKDLSRKDIGLKKEQELYNTLPESIQKYLGEKNDWFVYLTDFRDALVHRIPLYVPPCRVNDAEAKEMKRLESKIWECIKEHRFDDSEALRAEQDRLGQFVPLMMHSYYESKSPIVYFHAQMLCDWGGVVELAKLFLKELQNGQTQGNDRQ